MCMMNNKNVYSKKEARRILCRYHNLDGAEMLVGKAGVEKIMHRIHSIQYDPLNVVARNADLALQARVRDYKKQHLYDLLYEEHKLFDGFDKEMCIVDSADFSRFRFLRSEYRNQILPTLQYRNQTDVFAILDDVKAFVEVHGITGAKDISIGEVRESRWGHRKLSSVALDYLFNSGVISVADRKGTQKYFDLTERIFNGKYLQTDQDMTVDEFVEWYVERRIQSVGFLRQKAGAAWQGYYVSNNELRNSALKSLIEKQKITEFKIEGTDDSFYCSSESRQYFENPGNSDYARIIAPLDNIMWDRKTVQMLFGFTYSWEVYLPADKRKYGYYVLPVLYNDQLVARFEAEPIRQTDEFVIKNWWWEHGVTPTVDMAETIDAEMNRFADFLNVPNAAKNIIKIRSITK